MARIALAAALLVLAGQSALASCPGDCDGNGSVSVDELVITVTIALGVREVGSCTAADVGGDGKVSVPDLIRAVRSSLDGCPAHFRPCGESANTCDGMCPDGERCSVLPLDFDRGFGDPFANECGCVEEDAPVLCGAPGDPTCGGACPDGGECRPFSASDVGQPVVLPDRGGQCGCSSRPCGAGGLLCDPIEYDYEGQTGITDAICGSAGSVPPECVPCNYILLDDGTGGCCLPFHVPGLGWPVCAAQ
jgi:hypothetical protein